MLRVRGVKDFSNQILDALESLTPRSLPLNYLGEESIFFIRLG